MVNFLKIKKINNLAIIPTKAYNGDAGYDLYCLNDEIIIYGQIKKISTGIAIQITDGYSGFIWDRSSMGNLGLKVFGGVIDNQYRGEIFVCLGYLDKYNEKDYLELKSGSKIAQLCLYKTPNFIIQEVSELEETDRGLKGFGSSN